MRTGDPAGRREWETRLRLPAGELEGIVHGSDLWLKAQRGVITPEEYWSGTAACLQIPLEDLPALQADYFRDDSLDQDLIALATSLRATGYKVGLLSNDAATLEKKLRQDLGIYDCFDAVLISATIGVMKPDPRAYQAIARALGVETTQCVFIDDNRVNVEGARRSGMQAIHFVAGMDLRAVLASMLGETV